MRKSLKLSLAALFASLHVMFYFISYRSALWRNWAIYLMPVEAVVLGPETGFLAAIIGSMVARMVTGFSDPMWMFGLVAEPVSVLVAALLANAKWKPALAVYAVMLSAYFIHPFGRALTLWTILDILLALLLIYPVAKLSKHLFRKNIKNMSAALVLISFICVATDSLVRIFILVPCGLHSLFFGSYEDVYLAFTFAAFYSYIEDLLVIAVSLLVSVPLIATLSRLEIPVRD